MSLRLRVDALSRSEPRQTPQPVLLPYDSVREYLSSHEAVAHSDVSAPEVYQAILALHARIAQREAKLPDRAAGAPPRRPTCQLCHVGYEKLDAREGCLVCDSCGAVLTRSINVQREWQDVAEVDERAGHSVSGVAWWMVERSLADEPRDRPSARWGELQTWNQFTRHSTDFLRCLDRELESWGGPPAQSMTRMLAVLLYPFVAPQIRGDAEVREHVRRAGRHLARRSPCATRVRRRRSSAARGAKEYSAKAARYHCRFKGGAASGRGGSGDGGGGGRG